MEPFEYARPNTRQEAIGLLGANWNDAAVLAGGTDLISLMKEYVVTPKRIVNINRNTEAHREYQERCRAGRDPSCSRGIDDRRAGHDRGVA